MSETNGSGVLQHDVDARGSWLRAAWLNGSDTCEHCPEVGN